MTTEIHNDDIRATVRSYYAQLVNPAAGASCCGPNKAAATGAAMAPIATCFESGAPAVSLALGYCTEDINGLPDGANLGLGCGNPQAIARLQAGETVVDLGSGGGFDCFLAARQVGASGTVIGVDMTPAMISQARNNAAELGNSNVSFRLGEIENLPIADEVADVVLSNCVINLSPAKGQVFREALRILKPGGRLAIKDVVALSPLPEGIRSQVEALVGCVSGTVEVAVIETLLIEAGFQAIKVTVDPASRTFIKEWLPGSGVEDYVASASIEAIKAPQR